MNRLGSTLIIILACFAFGCEQDDIVESDVDFIPAVVVRAELKANKIFEGVTITRTLPINETYSIRKAEIKDATAFLRINGHQLIPLHYYTDGIYKPFYDLVVQPGYNYELVAEADGEKIYSSTIVPSPPVISNAFYHPDYYLGADVASSGSEVYGAVWVLSYEEFEESVSAEDYYSIIGAENSNGVEYVKVRTQVIPEQYRSEFYTPDTYIKVFAFDQQFLEYFQSKLNNNATDNVFAQGGGKIAWNVYGENVVGIFMGMAESGLKKPQ